MRSSPLRHLVLPAVLALSVPGVAAAQAQPTSGPRHVIRAGGVDRSYLLYLPASRRAGEPLPVLLALHGAGGRAADMARHTGLTDSALRRGYAVVYPEGIERRWNDGRGYRGTQDDVEFIRLLLDSLGSRLPVNPQRIYATGISNGAMFAQRLACDLPGTFAAIAPVAGALPAAIAARCEATNPVAVAAFQGTRDPLMPYRGGGVAARRGQVLSAARTADLWATVNGCATPAVVTAEPDTIADGTRVRRATYSGCREGREVVLFTIEGGGHTWPGDPSGGTRVGRVSHDIDATRTILDFFDRSPPP